MIHRNSHMGPILLAIWGPRAEAETLGLGASRKLSLELAGRPGLEGQREDRLLHQPRGSKYPIFEVSGSKNHALNGIWYPRP